LGLLAVALLLFVAACGPVDDSGASMDGGVSSDAGLDAGPSPRLPLAEDRVRYGVVSHPRDIQGAVSSVYQVFRVATDGSIVGTEQSFELGHSTEGEIVFTPDGEVGLSLQNDGSVGVFRLDTDGVPTVINPALTGVYASQIVMGEDGLRAYAVDFNWEKNGGGIYELSISKSGEVSVKGRVLEGRSLGAMALIPGSSEVVVAGRGVLAELTADRLFHLDLATSPPTLLSSAPILDSNDIIVGSIAFSGAFTSPFPGLGASEDNFVLVGDTNSFSGSGHRVGVARFSSSGLQALSNLPQVPNPTGLTIIEDPRAIYPSPFGGKLLVVSGTGDAVFSLSYDPGAPDGNFQLESLVRGSDPGPALPFGSTQIKRGALRGMVIVSELFHLRGFRFEPDGSLTDLGRSALTLGGLSLTNGSIGIQP